MKVCYLTWGETPRSYSLFGSQVIGQFVETKKIMPDTDFHFISAIPIVHSGLVREKWSYLSELRKVDEMLNGIPFYRFPIYASQQWFDSTERTFPWFHGVAHRHLAKILKKIIPDIVHCRSYHAAWAALKVKQNYNLTYKIIFDGRGLWAEETALKKRWSKTDRNFLFLKSLERELLNHCEAVIAVSDTMKSYYESEGAKNVSCIYLSSDTNKLSVSRSHNNVDSPVVFCYLGALSEKSWHKPSVLFALYDQLRLLCEKSKLLIITTSDHTAIRQTAANYLKDEITIISTKTLEELQGALSEVDFGLMSYFKVQNENETLLGRMVLAVKTAEYLAAGLPIIVNKQCGGAAKIVEQFNVGIAYSPENFSELTTESVNRFFNDGRYAERSQLAKQLFDYKTNARKYKELYHCLK